MNGYRECLSAEQKHIHVINHGMKGKNISIKDIEDVKVT